MRIASDGTFLSQEDARSFVSEDSRSRGLRVLSGYSVIAQIAQANALREYENANRQRQDWLKKFGLNSNIKRSLTRWERLSKHFIDTDVVKLPSQVTLWLDAASIFSAVHLQASGQLKQHLASLDSEEKRDRLSLVLAQLGEKNAVEAALDAIVEWLDERNSHFEKFHDLVQSSAALIQLLIVQRPDIEDDLRRWKDWYLEQKERPPATESTARSDDEKLLADLRSKLEKLQVAGNEHRLQLDHLQQLQNGFLKEWLRNHPNTCPTCNTDHAQNDGIEAVVMKMSGVLAGQLARERTQFADTQLAIREVEKRRSLNGQCPLSPERRAELASLLGFDVTRFNAVEELFERPDSIQELLMKLDTFVAPPKLVSQVETVAIAGQMWRKIFEENLRGEALWRLPDQWDEIRKKLSEKAMEIVQYHLPQTLESVWREISMALTAARWNLLGIPSLEAELKRGGESLKVLVRAGNRSIPAKHFYNQAEQHCLGLAWFFTRYLAFGRFHNSLVTLDDPAQEMDQTTFRTFTRFIQCLLRLHVLRGKSLKLVIFLHQEERALDLARATNQRLTAIRWRQRILAEDQNQPLEDIVLLSPEFRCRIPADLRAGELSPV